MTDPDPGLILHVDGEEPIAPELRAEIEAAHARAVDLLGARSEAYSLTPCIEPAIVAAVNHCGNIYTVVMMGRGDGEAVRRSFIHCEGALVISGSISGSADDCNWALGIARNIPAFSAALVAAGIEFVEAARLLHRVVWRADATTYPGMASPTRI
ncbi:MAG: hypothetical protein V3V08_05515 [Nannocystaceae bacterium]